MDTSFINGSIFQTFINFTLFTAWYQKFLGLFPPATQWFVSLIVLASIVMAFFVLIRTHWIFLIVLIVLIPFIYPVLQNLFYGLYSFVLLLWHSVVAGAPALPK